MSTMGNSSVTKEVPVDISLDEMVRSEMVISEAATSTADVILKVDSSDSNNNNSMWTPKEEEISSSFMRKFQSLIEEKYKLKFDNYESLWQWSTQNYVSFWEEVWHFTKIIHSSPYTLVLDKKSETVDSLPFKWFDGALLNYAENLLRYDDDRVALYSTGEAFKETKSITFKQLRKRVGIYQRRLKALGVKSGDIVVGYMPNCIECVEAKLAVLSLGAVWSCAPPDFGPQSVIDRFSQVSPRVLFSVTSVAYNGKKHDQIEKLNQVVQKVESIEVVVIVPFYQDTSDDIQSIPRSVQLEEFLKEAEESQAQDLVFEQLPFNHPLVILYSSGTTGTPKCIVHSHGGTLIQHLKEHMLHGNMTREDIHFFYTSTGWMMYDWLLSSLAIGCSVVLYDGSPILPKEDNLWKLVDELGITIFGTSAKYLAVIEERFKPKELHNLSTLRIIYSTGSPLKPASFDYVYSSIKTDLVLGSITGGSDIISLFCGANVNLPVYRGEIQCRQLGMAIECWNEAGEHVLEECGEMVCTKPFPSMPIHFHRDEGFAKYKASYFEKNPGVWTHGDFCTISKSTGGVVMLGRSDGTLNPNGIRFGSADIYNIVETLEEVEDSLCVGQKNPNLQEEERVILFVKLKKDKDFNKDLIDKIKYSIRIGLSPRHVPSIVLEIKDIPYTINGKKVEVPVRKIIEGQRFQVSSSLLNPQSLEFFKECEALKKW